MEISLGKKEYEVTVSEWEYQNTICKDMMIGWHHIEPQRARSNNSILLLRDKTYRDWETDRKSVV